MSAPPKPRPADELLLAIAAGDRVAFEELYRRYAAWLLVRLRRRCADPALAEEVVQETFLAVGRAAGHLRARDWGGARPPVGAGGARLGGPPPAKAWRGREPRWGAAAAAGGRRRPHALGAGRGGAGADRDR